MQCAQFTGGIAHKRFRLCSLVSHDGEHLDFKIFTTNLYSFLFLLAVFFGGFFFLFSLAR